MKTVLHIAAHMGGGVGKVLSNVAKAEARGYQHTIVLLEKPIDVAFTKDLTDDELIVTPTQSDLICMMEHADIVQVDWWNHPLTARVLYDIQDIETRLVIWSHTAGCYGPYIKPSFALMPFHFIFSSKYSRDNPYWTHQDVAAMRWDTSVINSSGGFATTKDVPLQEHEGFNVGYIGTLGYVKLLPQFVEWCKEIADVPDIKFVMVGRIPDPNLVLEDAIEAGIDHLFEFKGYVDNLPAEIAKMDVLGYLLNPHHFGTTENALLEAMSMKVPPVCIDQCAERYLIQDGINGYLVKNKQTYMSAIWDLYANKRGREKMGNRARNHVLQEFSLENTIGKLNRVYDKVMCRDKYHVCTRRVIGETPYDWYKSGLPPGMETASNMAADATKGSVRQWFKYYPGDNGLKREMEARMIP